MKQLILFLSYVIFMKDAAGAPTKLTQCMDCRKQGNRFCSAKPETHTNTSSCCTSQYSDYMPVEHLIQYNINPFAFFEKIKGWSDDQLITKERLNYGAIDILSIFNLTNYRNEQGNLDGMKLSRKAFEFSDTNGDGSLSEEEFLQAIRIFQKYTTLSFKSNWEELAIGIYRQPINGQPRPQGYTFDLIVQADKAGVVPKEFIKLFEISREARMISWFSSRFNPHYMVKYAQKRKGRLTIEDVKQVVTAEYEFLVDLFYNRYADSSRDPAYFTESEFNDIVFKLFDVNNRGTQIHIDDIYEGLQSLANIIEVKFINPNKTKEILANKLSNVMNEDSMITKEKWDQLANELRYNDIDGDELMDMVPFYQRFEKTMDFCKRKYSIQCSDDYFEPGQGIALNQCHAHDEPQCGNLTFAKNESSTVSIELDQTSQRACSYKIDIPTDTKFNLTFTSNDNINMWIVCDHGSKLAPATFMQTKNGSNEHELAGVFHQTNTSKYLAITGTDPNFKKVVYSLHYSPEIEVIEPPVSEPEPQLEEPKIEEMNPQKEEQQDEAIAIPEEPQPVEKKKQVYDHHDDKDHGGGNGAMIIAFSVIGFFIIAIFFICFICVICLVCFCGQVDDNVKYSVNGSQAFESPEQKADIQLQNQRKSDQEAQQSARPMLQNDVIATKKIDDFDDIKKEDRPQCMGIKKEDSEERRRIDNLAGTGGSQLKFHENRDIESESKHDEIKIENNSSPVKNSIAPQDAYEQSPVASHQLNLESNSKSPDIGERSSRKKALPPSNPLTLLTMQDKQVGQFNPRSSVVINNGAAVIEGSKRYFKSKKGSQQIEGNMDDTKSVTEMKEAKKSLVFLNE